LIFTALEDTLLDPLTESFAGAEAALEEIDRRKIPLILSSQKTRAQLDPIRRRLGHSHPFISENGGGIFIPDGYFNLKIAGLERRSRFLCLPIAKPHADAIAALEDISSATGVSVVSFHEMTPREISQNTGLSPRDAEPVKLRDFDEPFFFAGATASAIRDFQEEAARHKATLYQDGRFWHISLGCNLGQAVRALIKLYLDARPRTRLSTVGVGTLPTDAPLLKAVDQPILLPDRIHAPASNNRRATEQFCNKETNTADLLKALPKIFRAEAPGAKGWERAILAIVAHAG
jgi:mannosyl-3-phosphoglycerate phosphatase